MARVRDGEGVYESTARRPTEPADASVEPERETAYPTEPDASMVKPGSETVGMQTDPTEEAAVDASESQPGNETVELERNDAEGQAIESPIEQSTEAVEAAEEELVGASEEEDETVTAQVYISLRMDYWYSWYN
ncbi:predicted protein [Arabidopsis lyrata subsp. lyrata]|uniref:Predicted protein n=1 Tax=Arabidopsis lyrata subsp. lyrata TaxID=81972 RepID=D7M7P7_ARALL|nr:predicted protein [Arabidopsis lyrata subsp. lyrata]